MATTTTSGKELVHRVFDSMNARNLGVYDELIDPTYVNHNFPTPAPGAEGFKQVVQLFLTGFPDFRVTVEETVAEGDRVASRGAFYGTHRGEFMGIPATGKEIAVGYIDIWRAEAGRLVENWVQMDTLGLLQQLGAIPAPGQ